MDQTPDELTGGRYVEETVVVGPDGTVGTEPYTDMNFAGPGSDEVASNRAGIEQTRAEMSGTLDAIQNRLSPDTLAQQAKDAVHDATVGKVENAVSSASNRVQQVVSDAGEVVEETGSSLLETIRQNPVPAALAGIGLGWLFMSHQRSSSPQPKRTRPRYGYAGATNAYPGSTAYGYPNYQYAPQPGSVGSYGQTGWQQPAGGQGMAGQAANSASGMVENAQQAAGQAADTAQQVAGQAVDTAQQVAGQAVDTAQQVAYQATQGAQQAVSGFERMMRENPLAVGAASLAVGAAIGLAIPETHFEDQWMGDARETVVERAQDTARQAVEQVEQAAQTAVGAAEKSLQPQQSGQSSKQQGSQQPSKAQGSQQASQPQASQQSATTQQPTSGQQQKSSQPSK